MTFIGIALLLCLFVAIIGKRGAQNLLKGIGIIIALIAVYLAVGSQIIALNHANTRPTSAAPQVYDQPTPNPASTNIWGGVINDRSCREIYPAFCRSVSVP